MISLAVAQHRLGEIINGKRSIYELILWAKLRPGGQVHPSGTHADGSAFCDIQCRCRSKPLERLQHTNDKELENNRKIYAHLIYGGMGLPLVIGGRDPQIPGPLVRSGPAPSSVQMPLAEHNGHS